MGEPLSALGLPSSVLVWQALLLTVVSYLVGVLGGFVGLALGTVRLPVMLMLGMPVAVAGGTNIIVSTLSAFAGSVGHLRARRVDRSVVLWMGVPSLIGAGIGGLLSGVAPEAILLVLIGGFVMWQGLDFARMGRRGQMVEAAPITRGRRVVEGGIGLVVGGVGGAVGLILGSVRLPALVRVLGLTPQVAAGTNLFIGMLTGIAGFAGHAAIGLVDYPLLALMGATAIAGQLHGARLTGRASPRALLLTMAAVLVLVGALMLWEGLTGFGA